MDFFIRPPVIADKAAWEKAWKDYTHPGSPESREPVLGTTFARMLDPAIPMHALLACATEGSILGFAICVYHLSTYRMEECCYLEDMFTVPAARRQGIATALLQKVIEQAEERGIQRVYWATQILNTPAQAVYDKLAQRMPYVSYQFDIS